jgi:hypothetical protein
MVLNSKGRPLRWKLTTGTNTVTYYGTELITTIKKFHAIGQGNLTEGEGSVQLTSSLT